MDVKYFNTRIDQEGSISISDIFLTPLRWTTGGTHYKIYKNPDNNSLEHIQFWKTTSKVAQVCKRIFGAITLLCLAPIVLLGAAIKACSSSSMTLYNYIPVYFEGNFALTEKAISKKAPCSKSTQKELQMVKNIQIDGLLNIWDEAGKERKEHLSKRQDLSNWIVKVKDPTKYTYIPDNQAPDAAILLKQRLQLIVYELQKEKVTEAQKEQVILALLDASTVCSPTWLEVAQKQIDIFKKIDSEENILLQYIQRIKEELILTIAKKYDPDTQWHVTNYVRLILGSEVGLDRSEAKFDKTVSYDPNFPKSRCLQIFNQEYTPQALSKMLANFINRDLSGSVGLIQFLSRTIVAAAEKHASANNINTENDEFDSATYALEKFYITKGKNYELTSEGASWILHGAGFLHRPRKSV